MFQRCAENSKKGGLEDDGKNKLKRQRSGKQEVARECGGSTVIGRGAWQPRAVPRLSGDWAGLRTDGRRVALVAGGATEAGGTNLAAEQMKDTIMSGGHASWPSARTEQRAEKEQTSSSNSSSNLSLAQIWKQISQGASRVTQESHLQEFIPENNQEYDQDCTFF